MTQLAGFHLHFYQPPRENPWLDLVPNEWSAWPYRDWNERITAECYRALVAVSLPTEADGARELVEPMTRTSFDVGPTLHRWLERDAPDVDRALIHQVRHQAASVNAVAIAAPLVHAILPLLAVRDRALLVAWGVHDFQRRFGVAPQAMWLPETAVDLETLEVLAHHGIRTTVLVARQAARVRAPGGEWQEVTEHTLDTSRPYLVRLPGGGTLTVVFGHGELSQRIAFGDLVADGERLADIMVGALGDEPDAGMLLVADGETFGHHQRFSDLGLATAVRRIHRHYDLEGAVGTWLESHEASWEVELPERSSWSCAHGVERWRSDCGCVTGEQPGWNQQWRAPLRDALVWLRRAIGEAADLALTGLVSSVDETLTDYGEVLAGVVEPEDFVEAHSSSPLDADGVATVLGLCELHRHLLCAFTSCAWFFAEPSEIETAIVLRHAAIALEQATLLLGLALEDAFVERLRPVRSNHPGIDGAVIWRLASEGQRYDAYRVAAGFAAENLACGAGARQERGCWRAEIERHVEGDAPALLNITLVHLPTRRRQHLAARAVRSASLDLRVEVRADHDDDWTELDLAELGDDVVARVAASWLVSTGSVDFAAAIDLLVADLLTRGAGDDDAAILVALAGAQRWVTPQGEASIRRALLALTGQPDASVDLHMLAPLARAVGLSEVVGGS